MRYSVYHLRRQGKEREAAIAAFRKLNLACAKRQDGINTVSYHFIGITEGQLLAYRDAYNAHASQLGIPACVADDFEIHIRTWE